MGTFPLLYLIFSRWIVSVEYQVSEISYSSKDFNDLLSMIHDSSKEIYSTKSRLRRLLLKGQTKENAIDFSL